MPTDLTPTRKLRDLEPHEHNVRFDDTTHVDELAASIASVGLLTPLTVQKNTNVVIAGHRRLAALKHLVSETVLSPDYDVPVHEIELDDDDATAEMLVENLQRDDLSPIEEARGYQTLTEQKLKHREIAERIGKSASLVSARLRLLRLPEEVQQFVHTGQLDISVADRLTPLASNDEHMAYVIEQEGDIKLHLVERWLEEAERRKILVRAVKWINEAGGIAVLDYQDLREMNKRIDHTRQQAIETARDAAVAVGDFGDHVWMSQRYDNAIAVFPLVDPHPEKERDQIGDSPEQTKTKQVLEAKRLRNAAIAHAVSTATEPKAFVDEFLARAIVSHSSALHLRNAQRYLNISDDEIAEYENSLRYFEHHLQGGTTAAKRHQLAYAAAVLEALHGGHNPPRSGDPITELLDGLGIELDELGAPVNYTEDTSEGETDDNAG